jgi:hypothetical protein
MSLYNAVCGVNPLYPIFLAIIGLKMEDIPRFRDVYTKLDRLDSFGIKEPLIVVYTRTGGGNRDDHREKNDAMAHHPLHAADYDDSFDSTFAHWEFKVPKQYADDVLLLHEKLHLLPQFRTPMEKFNDAMGHFQGEKADKPLPDVDKAELEAILVKLAKELGL